MRKHITPLDRYGEIGCPVWGLFPYYEKPRYTLFGIFEVTADARLFGIMVHSIAESKNILGKLLCTLLHLSRIPFPHSLFFLQHGLPTFWGKFCTPSDVPCALIPRCKNLTHLNSSHGLPNGPLDVLMMIDLLDHAHNPKEFLSSFAEKTKYLFLWSHGNTPNNWNAQHVISFSHEGLKKIAERSGFQQVANYPLIEEHGEFGMLLRSTRA